MKLLCSPSSALHENLEAIRCRQSTEGGGGWTGVSGGLTTGITILVMSVVFVRRGSGTA